MPKKSIVFLCAIGLVVSFTCCRRQKPWDVNISHVQIDPVEIKRYEKALFKIDPENLYKEILPYVDDFYLFLGDEIHTERGQVQLYDYITDALTRELFEDTWAVWADIGSLEKELTQAFRYFRYHFPHRDIPDVYSYVSGLDFDYPVKYFENNLIIGLDMFLGQEYENYQKVGIPAFKRNRFSVHGAPVEVMRTLAEIIMRESTLSQETLLDFMVYEGKILYFLDCMFPQVEDSVKIYFTSDHIQWAERNEGLSWTFYLNNEMLYQTERQLIQKLTGAAPFTAPFSNTSAPRMGVYNGWQMVRNYMRRNQDVGLQELMLEKDAREILSGANYRP